MSDKVETEFVVHDSASLAIEKIRGVTEKLHHSVKDVVGILAGVGGLSGAFEVHEAIGALNETFRAVGRIRVMTGLAANTAHGLTNTFKLAGIEAGEAERVIMMMTRKTELLDELGGAAVAKMTEKFKKLGINMKEDVVGQLEAMAVAAKRGQLDLGDLTKMFGVRGEAAVKLLGMLQKGPENIRKIVEETGKSGITATDMGNFARLMAAKRQLHHAFEETVLSVYKHALPAVTQVVNMIRSGVERWGPAIEHFGELLREHMTQAIALAKTFAKIMAARQVMGFLGTSPAGLVGGAGGLLFGGIGARAKAASLAAEKAGGAGGLAGLLGGAGQLLLNFGKLSVIGLAITAAFGIFKAVAANFHGWRDRLAATFGQLQVSFGRLYEKIRPPLFALADAFLWATEKIMQAATWLVDKVLPKEGNAFGSAIEVVKSRSGRVYGRGMGASGTVAASTRDVAVIGSLIGASARTASLLAGLRGVTALNEANQKNLQFLSDQKADMRAKSTTYQDFRGSKFDITQNFAEGFDPDRVAVAFSGQVAAIGERQLQSGFAPAFGVR